MSHPSYKQNFKIEVSLSFNIETDIFHGFAWVESENNIVRNLECLTAVIFDMKGQKLFEMRSPSADNQGVFHLEQVNPDFKGNKAAYALTEVYVLGTGYISAIKGLYFV